MNVLCRARLYTLRAILSSIRRYLLCAPRPLLLALLPGEKQKAEPEVFFSVHCVGDLLREYGNSHLQVPPSVLVKWDVGLAQVSRLLSTRYKCVRVRKIYTWHRLDSKAAKAWAYERARSPVVRTKQIPWRLNSSC